MKFKQAELPGTEQYKPNSWQARVQQRALGSQLLYPHEEAAAQATEVMSVLHLMASARLSLHACLVASDSLGSCSGWQRIT